ncbi:MAG: discoidin domain-containing protein [Armatimonadota bacterium]
MHARRILVCVLIFGILLTLCTVSLAADEFVVGATNIAAAANGGHIVAYSSQIVDENGDPVKQWEIGNLIDGKHVRGSDRPRDSYGWSSARAPSDSKPEWFILAFKEERTRLVSQVVFDPVTEDPAILGRWAKGFEIYVSNTTPDGPWAMVKSGHLLNEPIKQSFKFPPVECRYMKIVITSNWMSDQFVELGEVEVYEAIATGDTLDQLIIRLESLLEDLKRYRDSNKYDQPMHPEIKETPADTPEAAEAETEASGTNEEQ